MPTTGLFSAFLITRSPGSTTHCRAFFASGEIDTPRGTFTPHLRTPSESGSDSS